MPAQARHPQPQAACLPAEPTCPYSAARTSRPWCLPACSQKGRRRNRRRRVPHQPFDIHQPTPHSHCQRWCPPGAAHPPCCRLSQRDWAAGRRGLSFLPHPAGGQRQRHAAAARQRQLLRLQRPASRGRRGGVTRPAAAAAAPARPGSARLRGAWGGVAQAGCPGLRGVGQAGGWKAVSPLCVCCVGEYRCRSVSKGRDPAHAARRRCARLPCAVQHRMGAGLQPPGLQPGRGLPPAAQRHR